MRPVRMRSMARLLTEAGHQGWHLTMALPAAVGTAAKKDVPLEVEAPDRNERLKGS